MANLRDQLQSGLADRYRLDRELGRGGMATVFLAHDLRHKRPVALKVLHPELGQTLGSERFQREIDTVARLQHPNILTVHDSGETGGHLWFTMPFVEGESLRDRLRRELQLPVEVALRIATDAARALQYAHDHGVIHRDIKPENLLLTTDGSTLVADFGIARALGPGKERLTETGLSVGTPTYMSPEQAVGDQQLDARTDVYSLGTVLYEMLAGEPPFTGATAQTVIAKRLRGEIPRVRQVRPNVPESVELALSQALAPLAADRFVTAAEFARALLSTTSTPARIPSTQSADEDARSRPWVPMAAAALVLGTLIVVGVLVPWRRDAGVPTPSGLATSQTTLPRALSTSVAVLPLANVGGRDEDEYFSDGITDELTAALGKMPGLRVASRTSSYVFKGRRDMDVREIGHKLGVGTVLEGAVRRAGPRLRVQVQLISASDGFTLWSETYERRSGDVFDVQADIATSVAEALGLSSTRTGAQTLALAGTKNVRAHDLYLKGRFLLSRNTEADIRRSIGIFETALREDPSYALPHTGIAQAWMSLADDFVAPRDAWPKVRVAALRALQLDSTVADAHTLLGDVHQWYEKDLQGAEHEFNRALDLNPNEANAHFNLGRLLVLTARPEAGIDQYEQAILLDPLAPVWPEELARALVWSGYPDSALSAVRRALELDPNLALAHDALGFVHFARAAYMEAAASFERAETLGWPNASFGRAMVYAAVGRQGEAKRVAEQWEREAARRWVPLDLVAGVYAMCGEPERAFQLLERAYRERAGYLLMLQVRPDLMSLRDDPRFTDLAERLGLPSVPPGKP